MIGPVEAILVILDAGAGITERFCVGGPPLPLVIASPVKSTFSKWDRRGDFGTALAAAVPARNTRSWTGYGRAPRPRENPRLSRLGARKF